MKVQGVATLLLCLACCFPVALSEDSATLEDQDGSGIDLEQSGSGEWSAGEWETIISLATPNSTAPEISQNRNVSASPASPGQVTKPPGPEATPSQAKALSRGPPATAVAVVQVEPEILDERMTAMPPTEPRLAEEEESGDGAVEMSISPPLTTERRADSVFNIVFEEDVTRGKAHDVEIGIPDDSDLTFDPKPETTDSTVGGLEKSQGFLEKKEVLAGVVGGGMVGLVLAVALVSLMVYRMKKKDEGSYALETEPNSYRGYQKPHKQEEFLA
ncbi:hypothetical protein AAFF_G00254040 [Aldrovandia affinis]|uniref:Syndecan n=1 Tax=Aldrovandia affinis TaxID=143900 RepID=A0AAD7RCG1_9TELE|nr:hypothetical protein AAFF_G00254040 [Aldrovandia affinis]